MSISVLRNKLKNILGSDDQNGVIIERTIDFFKIATKAGAIFFAVQPDQSNFEIGDDVVVKDSQLFRINKKDIPVYYT